MSTVELAVLGVRHHGPGSARSVAAALDELCPHVVVVEGPPELDRVVAFAADPAMVPPVAAFVYVVDDPARASFYPMAPFSPEWVAIRWALAHGRPVRFADLPAANHLVLGYRGDPAPGSGPPGPDALGLAARAAGYADPERWWEDAVEHAGSGSAGRALGAFDAVADLMAELRHQLPAGEEDLVREAAMRRVLREVTAGHKTAGHGTAGHGTAGHGQDGGSAGLRVAVVCGAWHVPALVRGNWPSASSDSALLKGLPKARVEATWAPWTYGRLGAASGYGAGVVSPGWYDHLFTATDHPGARWLVRTAQLLREEQVDAPPATVVEATRLAEALAALRGRPMAGLAELWEASQAVFCGGSPAPMELVRQRLVVGERLGSVPEGVPMVPLARDLALTRSRLRLKLTPVPARIDLDLRTPSHRQRSVLFHRLQLLDIRWAVPTSAGNTTGTFKESWALAWKPELAVSVVEAARLGATVAEAAANAARRRTAGAPIDELCQLVETVLVADLDDVVDEVMSALEARAALAHDVTRLMAAVAPLARTARYGNVRGHRGADILPVLDAVLTRACIGLPVACQGLDDEGAAEMREHLDGVQRGLATLDDAGLRRKWADALRSVMTMPSVGGASVHGLVAGRATRLLVDQGGLSAEKAATRLSLALSPGTEPASSAAFVEGFLQGDALLLVHDPTFLRLVDEWLAAAPGPSFDDILPLLRRAFSGYQPAERRAIAARARDLGTPGPVLAAGAAAGGVGGLDLGRACKVHPVMARLLGLSVPPGDGPGAGADPGTTGEVSR